jgi:hypothetical protein
LFWFLLILLSLAFLQLIRDEMCGKGVELPESSSEAEENDDANNEGNDSSEEGSDGNNSSNNNDDDGDEARSDREGASPKVDIIS